MKLHTNGQESGNVTIKNTHNPEKIDIPVTKKWVGGVETNRPEIQVQLYKDGEPVESRIVTLNEENAWTDSFKELDKYENHGTLIKYEVEEVNAPAGYTSEIVGSDPVEGGFTITNTIKPFDLSLRKFITGVNDKELKTDGIYDRAPKVDVTPLREGKETATYTHTKEPIKLSVGDIVTYTIRVYNEAEVDGYAEEITDHLPEELEFLPADKLNQKYLWEVDESDSTGRTIKTKYLSKENGEKNVQGDEQESAQGNGQQNTQESGQESNQGSTQNPQESVPNSQENPQESEQTPQGSGQENTQKILQGNKQKLQESAQVDGQESTQGSNQENSLEPQESTQENGQGNEQESAQENRNLLKGFTEESETLDYKDVQVNCRVKDITPALKKITNIAEITESGNEFDTPDRDNKEDVKLPSDENLPDYKGNDNNDEDLSKEDYYYEGQEDDDDFEKVLVEKFDLALRKFITGVNDEEITSRIPKVDASKYGTTVNGKEITDMEYTHPKDPVRVANNDIVIYTIRVYNEGSQSGYASEITDDIPEGLEFLPNNEINREYGWVMYDAEGNETTQVMDAVSIKTDYLSKEKEKTEGENLLKGYNPEEMNTPEYKDVQVAFKVTEPNTSDRILTNHAEISKDTDENGDEVDDIDSTPDEWKEDDDDQDVEHVYVKYFDLSLRKWISQVILIEDGVQKEMDTGHYAEQDPEPAVKVELNRKRIEHTIIKFRYQIRVTNEGEIEGYATEITDYIPEGLKFNQADNPKWREENGKIVTDQLKNTLLQPGEQATVEVVLTWINDDNNLSLKTNIAEISEDDNPSDSPDIDSTPNNKVPKEDDIDDAPVVLAVVTGLKPTYIALISGTILIIGAGIFAIKKYVI